MKNEKSFGFEIIKKDINDINKNEHINECDCNCRKCWTNKLGI